MGKSLVSCFFDSRCISVSAVAPEKAVEIKSDEEEEVEEEKKRHIFGLLASL